MSEIVDGYRINLRSIEGKQQGDIHLTCRNGHVLHLFFVDSPFRPTPA